MVKKQLKYAYLFTIILLSAIQSYAGDLYRNTVNKENVCGKPLIMEFEEVERTDHYSVCKIKHIQCAVLPSIVFEVHCFCEIAKLRNSKFFVEIESTENKNGTWTTKVAFMNSKDIDFMKLYGKDIKIDEIESVEDCKYY